jgi:hypothetical protein
MTREGGGSGNNEGFLTLLQRLEDSIGHMRGEMGVWSSDARYLTLHGGLVMLGEEHTSLHQDVLALTDELKAAGQQANISKAEVHQVRLVTASLGAEVAHLVQAQSNGGDVDSLRWEVQGLKADQSDLESTVLALTNGATSGRWTFMVWYPPHAQCVEPIAWTPHGGTLLLCCVNDRVRAAPYHGQRRSGIAGERVVREGGMVLDFGLFPASEPTAQVLVKSSGSPSRYGSHVPILLLDSLSDTEVTGLMEGICQSPPSKLLHTGADLLLTAAFRGVYDSKGRGLDREVLLSGSHPLTDDELGLCPLLDEGTGTSSADTQGLNWLPESLDDEMIKGDHQKADTAAVPDHLWLRAFAMGYGVRGPGILSPSIGGVKFAPNYQPGWFSGRA